MTRFCGALKQENCISEREVKQLEKMASLLEQLADERNVSDKLEKALMVAKAFCDGLTAEECPDTVAIPISTAISEVAALRATHTNREQAD